MWSLRKNEAILHFRSTLSVLPRQAVCKAHSTLLPYHPVQLGSYSPLVHPRTTNKLIWLLSRLDGKGPGARSVHCISRWESPLCCHHTAFLLTGHAQWATPHTPPTPSLPPRACLNQSVGGGFAFPCFSSDLQSPRHENSFRRIASPTARG
ncbi:translocase of outer mitochondrial membrane 20 isoform X3 [Echeneis naucrates]|uniref:translocase of outer mitochondrial membrane 20 isoform X3 n=1 Tax=Echeneis naucrates TaxID=173247 RepID=UPI001113C357|nr:uncharacterized protein LOC115055316 isoform X3 [Echeneis naucrates]